MTFERIGVVGLGIMGAGIVEVFAKAGLQVVGVAESEPAVEQGKKNLATSLSRAVSREKITQEQADEISACVSWGTDFELFAECDLVVEAAPEIMSLKQQIFSELDRVVKPESVLASNTSSLSVSAIAEATERPEQVVGMHFFNPAPIQKFVEVIATDKSHADIVEAVAELAKSLGKSPAVVADKPGFIVNKLLLTYLNHAVRLLDEGVASREVIDSAMRELAHFPMGPLELLDLIGLDTSVEVLHTIEADTRDPLDAPAASLLSLIAAGNKGRKTGSGFYDYAEKHEAPSSDDQELKIQVHATLMKAYLHTARAMNESGYASQADIDMGMKLGCGLPEGPFETMDHFVS